MIPNNKNPKKDTKTKKEKKEKKEKKQDEQRGEDLEVEEDVTNENKKEYVDLVISYYLNSTKSQMEAIREGFMELIPQEFLDELDPQELEMMLFGRQDVDVKEFQEHTNYDNGLTDTAPLVKLFWEVLEKFTQEELRKFLVFCTGSSKVPLGGFAHLYGSNGPQKFTLNLKNSPGLPTAHSCFNRLELYYYHDHEQLRKDLLYAISETQGFTLE